MPNQDPHGNQIVAFYDPTSDIRPNMVSSDYVLSVNGRHFPTDTVYQSPLFWRKEVARRIAVALSDQDITSIHGKEFIGYVIESNWGCDGSSGTSVWPYCALFPDDWMALVTSYTQAIARALLPVDNTAIRDILDQTDVNSWYSNLVEREKIKWLLQKYNIALVHKTRNP
jgi:hypothetical protein